MNAFSKFCLFVFAVAATFLIIRHGGNALHAALPTDMPSDSRFVQTGFDIQHNEPKGEWIACRADAAEENDWCRVTDARGTVVYQGGFSPVASDTPVPNSQLQTASNHWVTGPSEHGPVPVIHLRNGQNLVPSQDRQALRDRWAVNPEEYRQIQGM